MEGDFFRKGETYEQTTRLSSYVRANSTTDGGQAKNFFAVIQQQRIRSMVAEIKSDITIDELFYS